MDAEPKIGREPNVQQVRGTMGVEACHICGSTKAQQSHGVREMLFGTREVWEYLECSECGVLRLRHPPPDLADYYPNEYFEAELADNRDRFEALDPSELRRRLDAIALFGDSRVLRRAARVLGASRPDPWINAVVRLSGLRSFADPILDVGCGQTPRVLERMRSAGFTRLVGVDPYIDANQVWRGITLTKSSIHDSVGQFQLVMMHHSFEHVPDPVEVMSSARGLLRPGGTLLIRTPVMGTWFWEHYGTDWWELDAPRHLFIHTERSLRTCAERAGFELATVVWDSSYLEVIASDQIRRGVAWREDSSFHRRPPAGYDNSEIAKMARLVEELNRVGRAGRAGFYFRPDPGRPGGNRA